MTKGDLIFYEGEDRCALRGGSRGEGVGKNKSSLN